MATDYQDTLRCSALAFLERHHTEHLADDQRLVSRAAKHLMADFSIPAALAAKVVHVAFAELIAVFARQRLKTQEGLSDHALIIDPVTGQEWAVPVSLIYERIINAPETKTFRFPRS